MGFTKLDETILRSSIMAEQPETFKVFIAILAATDPDSIARVSSIFLAGACYLDLETIDEAIKVLESPDPRSRSMAEDGRRIRRVDGGYLVINYQKYREHHYSRKHEATRKREYRKRKKEGTPLGHFGTGAGHSASASASASASELKGGLKGGKTEIPEIREKWNRFAEGHDLPKIHKIEAGSARERTVLARIHEGMDFEEILKAIHNQPFLFGDNDRGWLTTFDWIMKPANQAKILEGAYVKNRIGEAKDRAAENPLVGHKSQYGGRRPNAD